MYMLYCNNDVMIARVKSQNLWMDLCVDIQNDDQNSNKYSLTITTKTDYVTF